MIKNIVFDFGQVMIQYKPNLMADKYIDDPSDREAIYTVLFDRAYWDPLDWRGITDEELISASKARLPERLHAILPKIYYNWIYNLPEMPGMNELVSGLRSKYGVRVFLLSNISEYFANHAYELPVMNHFDKCVFSAVAGCIKPSAEIFDYLCRECDILPEETLFIDDSEKNIKGARDFGLLGYVFDGDAEKLSLYLEKLFSECV